MFKIYRVIMFFVLITCMNKTFSLSKSENHFSYSVLTKNNAENIDASDIVRISWEPRTLTEGFQLSFWGMPDPNSSCEIIDSGSVVSNMYWANSLIDTGIVNGSEKWAPECNNWQGISYIRIDSRLNGGIGLYTHTGDKPWDQSASFWQPYPVSGDRTGSNLFISGTFATFRFKHYKSSSNTLPWKSSSFLKVYSEQNIVSYQVISAIESKRNQVQQQIHMSFINLYCRETTSNTCQVQTIMYPAVINSLSLIDSGYEYPTSASLFADKSQGGIAVVFGNINKTNEDTYLNNKSVWTSYQDETLHNAGKGIFDVNISWVQFQNILMAVAELKEIDIVDIFGEKYDNENEWVLLSTTVSQEVKNPEYLSKRVYIGGYIKSLHILSELNYDINNDNRLNILDLISTIRNPTNKFDCNKDGDINILDTICHIRVILQVENKKSFSQLLDKYPKIRNKLISSILNDKKAFKKLGGIKLFQELFGKNTLEISK